MKNVMKVLKREASTDSNDCLGTDALLINWLEAATR